MAGKAIYAGLMQVQQTLKAPKDKDGGKYRYRSAEDILENVKPLLKDAGLILKMKEEIKADAIGSYIESVVTVIDIATGDREETSSQAREDVGTKFMSPGQATGAAISYARKYALCGMFAIDNEDDLDSPSYQKARQDAQNAPQTAKNTNKGKYMASEEKMLYDANDAVRKANIAKLNAEINRIGLKPAEVLKIAKTKFGVNKRDDMSDTQLCILAENLEKWAHDFHIAKMWGEDKGALNQ